MAKSDMQLIRVNAQLTDQNERYRAALKEILEVATVSEGVGWYAYVAAKALRVD